MPRSRSPRAKSASPRTVGSGTCAKPAARHRELQTALAGLAHEVRTPLNGILVLAELLASSDLPERERGWVETLKSAAEHLASLTTLVVDGARADIGALTPRREIFSPAEMAAALAGSLSARAMAKGLTAETTIADGLPPGAVGDPVLIRAAVENLLDNAVKFTERGRVAFALEAESLTETTWRLTFSVSDEGAGLTVPQLQRLFQPFTQASPRIAQRYGGAGLGLAFARQVGRAMGGDLTASSRPGVGSCFRFSVTVDVPAASDNEPRCSPAGRDEAHAGHLRILCAEDNPFGRAVINAMLTPLGHCIDFVGSGDAAVIATGRGGYDLVLMDVMLPVVDGIEATRQIRALAGAPQATPVIGMSGRGRGDEEQAARAVGMDAYLVKPITPATLFAALDAATKK